MTPQERCNHLIEWFQKNMPVAESELHYNNPFELLVAVILSAQCTDKRVNMVTPKLLADFPTAEAMAATTHEVIFEYIKSVSYPNNKAKHLAAMARQLVADFGGEVPSEPEELQKLQGVGRKTANVVASVIFNKPAMAAATFFKVGKSVTELQQAHELLQPLLGSNASVIFAVALLMAGVASSVTSGMAGGSIFAGLFAEPYDIKDNHSRWGVLFSIVGAVAVIFFISDPFQGLLLSQMLLSIQLPITVLLQVYLTSSQKVMGKYANKKRTIFLISGIAAIVILLNLTLLLQTVGVVKW